MSKSIRSFVIFMLACKYDESTVVKNSRDLADNNVKDKSTKGVWYSKHAKVFISYFSFFLF